MCMYIRITVNQTGAPVRFNVGLERVHTLYILAREIVGSDLLQTFNPEHTNLFIHTLNQSLGFRV